MSKLSSLSELANFVGKSDLEHNNRRGFWLAYKTAAQASKHRPEAASVSDLLASVMAISARTRRIMAPKTNVELDVFTPNGQRAVQLIMGNYN